MHERSLIRALLRQVEALSVSQRPGRVVEIAVRVGEFAGVESALLASAFADLVADSSLREARLNIESVPLEAVCQQCGRQFRVDNLVFQCAACGSRSLKLIAGEELQLKSFVMEEYHAGATV